MKRKKGKYLSFHLMLLIPTALLVVYCYVPMAGIIIAFQNYKPALGFTGSKFTGLENFRVLFTNPGFMQALKNTVVIAFWKIITGLIVPVTFSLLLNEIRRSSIKRTAQTIIYMPYFISWVLMAGIIVDILSPENGIVNRLLGLFGVEPVFFLGDNNWFKPVLVVTNVWKEFGWGTIIYMAALTGIDLNLYEAAAIDGAGQLKIFVKIMLPAAMTMMVTVFLFMFVWQYNDSYYTNMLVGNFKTMTSELSRAASDFRLGIFLNSIIPTNSGVKADMLKVTGEILAILPMMVVYLFGQKFLLEGVERSGLVG